MSFADGGPLVEQSRSWTYLPRFSFETGSRPDPTLSGLLDIPWEEDSEPSVRDAPYPFQGSQPRRKQVDEIIVCSIPLWSSCCLWGIKLNQVQVTWNGRFDRRNPLEWSRRKKWFTTLLVSLFTFISPFSTTMVTPALPVIASDLHIPNGFMRQLVMSIFLLGYALGPFILGPLSEVFGRGKVLQCSNAFYLIFNTACGFSRTRSQLLAFRFLAGMGGSAPQAVC
jgi:hypothetical protein